MPQCKGLAASTGEQCKMPCTKGSEFCSMHQPKSTKRPSGRRAHALSIYDLIDLATQAMNPELSTPDDATSVQDNKIGQYEVLKQLYGRSEVQFTDGILSVAKPGKKAIKMVYNREMPALTADMVVFSPNMEVLLIKRKRDPYKYFWAIPGGFVDINKQETAHAAAIREFKEEAGKDTVIDPRSVFHVFTATYPGRDPRQRTISVLFTTMLSNGQVKGGSADPDETTTQEWFPVSNVLSGKVEVAFDHKSLIARAFIASVAYSQMRNYDSDLTALLAASSNDIL